MALQAESCPPEKGIKELLEEDGISYIPQRYLLPPHARPSFSHVCRTTQPPVIDFAGLSGDKRRQIVEAISRACQDWGIFQVVNHGVPQNCVDSLWKASRQFFQLPARERMRWYSPSGQGEVFYDTTFGECWDDTLRFQPNGDENCRFNQAPDFCRETVVEFLKQMRKLAMVVSEALAENLGIDLERLEKYGAWNLTYAKLHYYSPCSDPSLVLGKTAHTDPNFLTILMQDQVGGLQVFKDESWVEVEPVEDAFLINIGDSLQILSNGKFKSAEHRVVTNRDKARSSVACFMCPSKEARVGPLSELITPQNPQVYREVEFGEYVQIFGKCVSKKYALKQLQLEMVRPREEEKCSS